jgi:hypothetical protein
MPWLAGDDRPGKFGAFGSADSICNVAMADDTADGLLNPIESEPAGTRE